jgi:hypothetical protein
MDMSYPVKVIRVDALNEKIRELEVIKRAVEKCLGSDGTSHQEMILKKYIESQNAVAVADYLNQNGYRITSDAGRNGDGRKYNSNDITEMISTSKSNEPLFRMARGLYLFNKSKITWGAMVKLCKEINNF